MAPRIFKFQNRLLEQFERFFFVITRGDNWVCSCLQLWIWICAMKHYFQYCIQCYLPCNSIEKCKYIIKCRYMVHQKFRIYMYKQWSSLLYHTVKIPVLENINITNSQNNVIFAGISVILCNSKCIGNKSSAQMLEVIMLYRGKPHWIFWPLRNTYIIFNT